MYSSPDPVYLQVQLGTPVHLEYIYTGTPVQILYTSRYS